MEDIKLKLAQKNEEAAPGSMGELYKNLVEREIRKKYSQSDVEAILNNYMSDPTDAEYLLEFRELQEYRKSCKARIKSELKISKEF